LSSEASNGVSGNYALLDAIAALKWVQANVSSFGGNPDNVTLYSESAGSGMASVLLGSPMARNLFHKLVIESLASLPAGTASTTLAQAEAAGSTYASNLGASDLTALRAKSAAEIMAGTGSVIGPVVDGVVWPDQLDLLLARGAIHDVPLLIGWNADEGTPYPAFATTLAGYNTVAAARYGAMVEQFKAVYPVSSDSDVLAMAYQPMRDSFFAWQPWTLARAHAAQGKSKTFLYHFNRRPPYAVGQTFTEQSVAANYGAYHSLEQVYFYNNLERSVPTRPYDDTDRLIAAAASSYLLNFARSGNPNDGNLTVWPEFTGPNSQALFIGDNIEANAVPFRAALDFYDAFYTQALGRPLPF
jgi:para-nitrobenzyl esterase